MNLAVGVDSILREAMKYYLAIFVPELKVVVDWSCDHSKRPQEEQNYN